MKVLILAGGGGTRLWPLSRQKWPKQFLSLSTEISDSSLLLDTIKRCLCQDIALTDIYIITGSSLIEQVNRELQRANFYDLLPNVISEPLRRNTAPAIALAAQYIYENCRDEQEVLAILPADHAFDDTTAFQHQLLEAADLARKGSIVTLGIQPTHPETGYGYIQVSPQTKTESWMPVQRFVEKPNYETACEYIESGCYFWNAGIFLMTLETLQTSFDLYAPEIATYTQPGYQYAFNHFNQMPDISIDYAVLERATNIVVMPLQSNWSDMGSWDNVYDVLEKNIDGNVIRGHNLQTLQTNDCLIWNESGRHIATIGLKDCLIVDTPDALMIAYKGRSQDIKDVVKKLESDEYRVADEPLEYIEGWGSLRQLTLPQKENPEAPAVFQVSINPNLIVQISTPGDIQWCVQSGNGIWDAGNTLKDLCPSISWTQESSEQALIQTGDSGLTLFAMGNKPTVCVGPHLSINDGFLASLNQYYALK